MSAKSAKNVDEMSLEEIQALLQERKAAKQLADAQESNVSMEIINGGKLLVVKIDLTKDLGESKSAKSRLVGSTHGNVRIADGLFASINVYRPTVKK